MKLANICFDSPCNKRRKSSDFCCKNIQNWKNTSPANDTKRKKTLHPSHAFFFFAAVVWTIPWESIPNFLYDTHDDMSDFERRNEVW